MKKESVNTFNGGLNYDLNPLTTPNNILTDNVNGTFVTFNGDELALQNDAGNAPIDSYFGTALEYDNSLDNLVVENNYKAGDRVFVEVVAEEVGDNSLEYFINVNINRILNPNFTNAVINNSQSVANWDINGLLKVHPNNKVTPYNRTNTLYLSSTGAGNITQSFYLLKNTEYNLYFYSEWSAGAPTCKLHYFLNSTIVQTTTLTSINGSAAIRVIQTPNIEFTSVLFEFAVTTTTAVCAIGEFSLFATGRQYINSQWVYGNLNNIINDPLNYNTEIWQSSTKVSLSSGFVPLAMKEYGGILYIISGKKGSGASDQIEFGSYPSPIKWDYNSGLLRTSTINSLNSEKFLILDNKDYTPGSKIEFATTATNDTYVSKYESGNWVRKVFKVGLYQKLETSIKDLTKEYSAKAGSIWYNIADPYINNSLYKGTLFTTTTLEPINTFKLTSNTLTSSGSDLLWSINIAYDSGCSINVSQVLLDYTIAEENTNIVYSNSSIITTLNTPVTITLLEASLSTGKTLYYRLTPSFTITGAIGSTLPNIDEYTSSYIILGSRVLPDPFELVILKEASIIAEYNAPATAGYYEYKETILTGTAIVNELIFTNEEGATLNSTLFLSNGVKYGFSKSGFIGTIPSQNVLSTYSFVDGNPIINDTLVNRSLLSLLKRVETMSLVTGGSQKEYNLEINYSAPVIMNSITYLNDDNSILDLQSNINLYHKPYAEYITSISNPTSGTLGYEGAGVYKTYSGGSWSTISLPNAINIYKSPAGTLKIGWQPGINSTYDSNTTYSISQDSILNIAICGLSRVNTFAITYQDTEDVEGTYTYQASTGKGVVIYGLKSTLNNSIYTNVTITLNIINYEYVPGSGLIAQPPIVEIVTKDIIFEKNLSYESTGDFPNNIYDQYILKWDYEFSPNPQNWKVLTKNYIFEQQILPGNPEKIEYIITAISFNSFLNSSTSSGYYNIPDGYTELPNGFIIDTNLLPTNLD